MSSLQNASPQAQPQQSSLSFTQGFLLGQLSVVILIGCFIKFFIFGDPPSPETTASARALARRDRSRSVSLTSSSSHPHKLNSKRSASHVLRPPPRLTTATILAKTYYNVNSHQPESLDWFNVLIAQTIAQFRNDAHDDDAILESLTRVLNGQQKPGFLSDIKVTEISLGEEFPILSNCRVHPVDDGDTNGPEGPRLEARMDVDLSDFITLGVETKIILNYPKPLTAVLPVALAVSVVRFSGTLSISFLPSHPTPASTPSGAPQQPPSTTPTTLAFSFLPDYRLDLSVRSLVGSRSRLQDIPKIAQLVDSRLHAWIDERCVEPRVQQVVLPSLWPRKKNTRGPGSADEEEAVPKEVLRDVREEARREVEEERRRDRERREREEGSQGMVDASGFEEGLRWRNRAYENMPGSMPGMMVN
ncbi:ERMES complex subunit mmm1 [Imshaugia aleurites]|uniref:Maintenance of mitochondrial morphology protein 1 n=1 Tax=Imshaugia aleurites TaxID=172621 RepID=A0A8H3EKH4_9LECA|nr:ERMES complex subunit mmm1 [Imshaugia aleurites]